MVDDLSPTPAERIRLYNGLAETVSPLVQIVRTNHQSVRITQMVIELAMMLGIQASEQHVSPEVFQKFKDEFFRP